MTVMLIDTNIWTGLLDMERGAEIVTMIERLQGTGALRILLPERIKVEWNNNYHKRLRQADKSHEQKLTEILPPDKIDTALGFARQHLERKESLVPRIEAIFQAAVTIKISNHIRKEVMIRYEHNQAPFHANKDSNNDGLIYFSVVRWCQRKGIQTLHFVSDNYKEFAAPGTKHGTIHPDLMIEGLEVIYYRDIRQALADMDAFDKSDSRSFDNSSSRLPIYITEASNGRNLLERWRNASNYYHTHLPFVPKRLLARSFPFQISTEEPIGTGGSTIYTNNGALVDYLEQLGLGFNPYGQRDERRMNADASRAIPKQLKSLFQQLNSTGITVIRKHRHKVDFDCRTTPREGDGCVRCKLRSLDFESVFIQLLDEPCDDLHQNLRQGYVHFTIGDYLAAFAFYKKALEQSQKEKLPVLELLCAQNLVMIQGRLRAAYDPAKTTVAREFKVDPDAIFAENLGKDMFVAEASKLVYRNQILEDEANHIADLHKHISEHYQIQAEGGFASNGNLRQLLVVISGLTTYLTENSIVGNYAQSRLEETYGLVVEAFFMCHSFNEIQSSRLTFFDDALLVHMISYATPRMLRDASHKYKVARLAYYRPKPSHRGFAKLAVQLINGLISLESVFVSPEENHGSRFEMYYGRLVGNALTLAAMLDLTAEENQKIAAAYTAAVVKGFPAARLIVHTDASRTFLQSKLGAFSTSQLKALCRAAAINLQDWKVLQWGEALGWFLSESRPQFLSKDRALSKQLREAIFEQSERDNLSDYTDFTSAWYSLLHPAKQEIIRARIEEELATDFSPSAYYIYAIHGVVRYEKWVEQFADGVAVPLIVGESLYEGRRRFAVSNGLSDLINLAFKVKLDTRAPLFDRFRGHTHYYDWLLDMDNFDYTHFEIEWITDYKTSLYLQKIFTHPKALAAVQKGLKAKFNPAVADYLVQYADFSLCS